MSQHVSELESRKVAEASRQTEWRQPSFLRELFLGNFRPDLLPPYPTRAFRPEFQTTFDAFKRFLIEEVDATEIDETGEYPKRVLDKLAAMRAFGLLVPKDYGGHGLDKVEWCKLMELLASYEGNLLGLLSPHQSVGVPETIKQFGTPEQKQKYLTRCAAGDISAFALTEPDVGSDPARLATTAQITPDGDAYILNGLKLWCTNGTLAKLLIVMARHPDTKKISAFVVETEWEGVTVEHRCHFMGLRALANGVIRFNNVRVPKENLVGGEGKGLKIALTVLNVGRLSVPSGAVGTAKKCIEICRRWAGERVQWGKPIGKHEAISHMIADMTTTVFAMEAIAYLAAEMAVRGTYDIRLEAAAAKEWNTCRNWEIVDNTFQIRGGRGYETERSLAQRGEEPIPVERMMRDSRITKVFEGASEIMHLFIAREAVDKHLQIAGAMVDPEASLSTKLAALPKAATFYAAWYPSRWLGWGHWPRYAEYDALATHLRFIERNSRKMARQIFHGMMVYQGKLQHKQAFLFRIVDIAMELFAMSASVVRAQTLLKEGHADAQNAVSLADMFCKTARRKVRHLFHDLWHNDDAAKYRTALSVLDGTHTWIEEGIIAHDEEPFPPSLKRGGELPGTDCVIHSHALK
ncbi:MAG: acyl-CoA dehydrogenase family protein [Candidatus Hydrogenedentes bacterium]|nr:acyl-CoA dehydrogenase family protein [Candidatus Hydrogenedentota bacterium]